MAEAASGPIPSWRPGHLVWLDGRTKLVVLGGIGSRTGEGERQFWGLAGYLARQGGYDRRRDVLEGTYAGRDLGQRWQPEPYAPVHTRQGLMASAEAVAGVLEWYRNAFPPETRFVVAGYSLGGVALFDGLTLALAAGGDAWRGRVEALITIASPLRGCNAGPFMHWAWLATHEPDPLGAAGADLDRRWIDSDEQVRVERRAAFLRASGVHLLTFADPDDAVVRPDEAVLLDGGAAPDDFLVRARGSQPGSMGHGGLLDEPVLWRRIAQAIGPQERSPNGLDENGGDPLQREIEAIKARLRAEGRLPGQ